MPLSPPTPHADVASLLAEHGLAAAPHEPMHHDGFSGASLVRLRRHDGAAFVLKRSGIDRDWIMRATDDVYAREAAIAIGDPLAGLRNPAVGVADDGSGYALLMRDITPALLPPGTVSNPDLDRILTAMARLHHEPAAVQPYHCDAARRLLLLSPAGARIAASYGAPVAADLARGWELFSRLAPPRAVALIHSLFADASPLLRALAALPSSLLHGDLKFDNIGIEDDIVWAVDWAMTLVAPAAVELGWFLAINSRRLPVPLDEVMRRYESLAGITDARHDALTVVCGLLLRGWRKALDADEGEPEELRWWCERAEDALPLLSA